MLRGMRVGITGGAGFLGARLTRALATENEVFILDVKRPVFADAHRAVTYVACNITDEAQCRAAFQGLDLVFHRAGLVGNVPSMRAPHRYYETNVRGTLNVLQACVQSGVRRLIFDSTEAVYGTNVVSPVSEEQVPRPTSLYGASKLIAECAVRLFDERHALSTLTFRYCRIRDADTADAVWILANKILNGDPITLYDDGTPVIDFVHVSDVIDANLRGAASAARNDVLNIGSGEGISFRDIVTTIEDLTGRKAASIQFEIPSRNRPSAEHLFGPASFYLSVEKAKRVLGWQPSVDTRASIAATVELVRSGRRLEN